MEKYVKKPVVVEAKQFNGVDDYTEILDWVESHAPVPHQAVEDFGYNTNSMHVPTRDGVTQTAQPGDFIVRCVEGEFYVCPESVFHKTYSRV